MIVLMYFWWYGCWCYVYFCVGDGVDEVKFFFLCGGVFGEKGDFLFLLNKSN